ncbi:MAG: DUF4199 domain-containing protein [Saprospiraceae bacterium]|nr:DUF4199 domain-containing protein [Saprospiraceae bacterium]
MTTLDDPRRIIDPSSVSVWPTALRYGGILGAIGVVMGLVMYLSGMADPETANPMAGAGIGCISMIVTVIVYVLAVKKHRETELGGAISFGRAFGMGMAVAVISGVISTVWGIIYNNLIAPDILEKTREMMLEQAQPGQEGMMETIANITTSPILGPIMTMVGTLIFGVIISLIVAAVMKKEPAPNI